MQNPPPITVSGQNSASVYQLTLQSASLSEIYTWAPQLAAKMRQASGLRGRQTDMQINAPQVMVIWTRPRPGAGRDAAKIQEALYGAYGTREVSVIYAPANQYSVILEVDPQYQRTPDALSKLYIARRRGH